MLSSGCQRLSATARLGRRQSAVLPVDRNYGRLLAWSLNHRAGDFTGWEPSRSLLCSTDRWDAIYPADDQNSFSYLIRLWTARWRHRRVRGRTGPPIRAILVSCSPGRMWASAKIIATLNPAHTSSERNFTYLDVADQIRKTAEPRYRTCVKFWFPSALGG
jgi:hypothetical protein